MIIEKLKVNHIENPIGYVLDKISLSWIVAEAKGNYAQYAQVQISTDEEFQNMILDTGKRSDINSLDCPVELQIEEGKRYFWRVQVWDDAEDSAVSEVAFFESAASLQPAKWITTPFAKEVHPLFRKKFTLKKELKEARLYICGLGVYEAYLNGEKIGDEYLAPFYNDYNFWLQYQTYDVSEQLSAGENSLGVLLGNGWYKGRFGYVEKMDSLYGDTFQLICKLVLLYENGTKEEICSDEEWLCAPSPILEGNIYDGESWDARMEIEHWADNLCIESTFASALPAEKPLGNLIPRMSIPVVIKEKIAPVALIQTNAGENVIDFGQNMSGWVEFDCEEEEGTEILLQFGEILQNGNFYNENLRSAKAEFRYISDGTKKHVRPHFTFYGFRYMKITGMKEIALEHFQACVIYSDMERSGSVVTSNEKINRLFLNALWGQKGNFLDVPTDCPQRDERMGWTGDAQVFCGTASLNMYTPAFYRKYMYDMRLEQSTLGGAVPYVVPDALGQIERIQHKDEEFVHTAHSSCAWSDAATIIPWNQYLSYGDRTMLEEQYENMKSWTDCIRRIDKEKCGDSYLWTEGFHFADWLALDSYQKDNLFGATDRFYVASVYYYYSASLTAKAAKVLGKEEDTVYYENMALSVKKAIQKEYFTETGRIAVPTQTAMTLALYFDLVPEQHKGRCIQDFAKRLEEDQMHLTTGFVGVSYLCPALTMSGRSDLAYTLLFNEDYPSWLYEVNMGATTIWERWNSVLEDGSINDTGMNSLNHYSYGSIVEWMYRYMCGLQVCEDGVGYRHFVIQPYVDSRLEWVSMDYHSVKGTIKSSWKKTPDGYEFQIVIPFDSKAEFVLTDDYSQVFINDNQQKNTTKGSMYYLQKGKYKISCKYL